MKKLFVFAFILFASIKLTAQTDGISYQALILNPKNQEIPGQDVSGNIFPNKKLEIRFTIINAAGVVEYTEVQSTMTDSYGMINLVIGQGAPSYGVFTKIMWDGTKKDLKVEINLNGSYTDLSNQALLFTPYAYHRDIMATGDLLVAGKVGFSGDLIVEGTTDLNKSLTVKNGSATQLTGSLDVDGAVAMNNAVTVGGATSLKSTLTVDGAMQVNNSFTVTGPAVFNDLGVRTLNVKSDNSAFVATFENQNGGNGDGLLIKLGRTHGAWNGSSYLNIENPLVNAFDGQINTVKGWLNGGSFSPIQLLNLMPATFIAGAMAQITNSITSSINDGLNLPIGFDAVVVPKTLILPEVEIFPGITMPPGIPDIPKVRTPKVELPSFEILPAIPNLIPRIPNIPTDGLPNLSIPEIPSQVVTNSLTKENQYVTFQDKEGRTTGTIRAQSTKDFRDNTILDNVYVLNVVASFTGIDLLGGIASGSAQISNLTDRFNKLGVEYSSGNGDYAEWLERIDQNEYLSAGDIVAVKGGKITRDLSNAEQIMAVSHHPIILGNTPEKGKSFMGNDIAFMGQVPVKVMGSVQSGDYIVANSKIKGYGIAIHPDKMKAEDHVLAVGRAWDNMPNEGPKMVNTVVGVHNGDWAKIITKIEEKQKLYEDKFDKIEATMKILDKKADNLLLIDQNN
ncbi:hypothetical protein [Flavobacterium xanthum]|uniref:Uncharacterized protein n=1 Tax=Flavobacterium xanthum TaxID=69322 RepID=A0A1M7F5U1_9FLAO|nr:hypothetical protein [Flavobacterium xanthum]SHL99128.1 hypothetical protein SAMN05443669_101932 [Flavobacterium xanthum]